MPYAGLGIRAVAAIIDGVIFYAIGYVVALFTGGATGGSFEISGMPFVVALALWVGYYTALEGTSGASLGKRLVGLRVVKADGAPLDWSAAVTRNVLRVVDGIVFYILGAVLIATSPQRQRLGDRVAGTVVLRRAESAQPSAGTEPTGRG